MILKNGTVIGELVLREGYEWVQNGVQRPAVTCEHLKQTCTCSSAKHCALGLGEYTACLACKNNTHGL